MTVLGFACAWWRPRRNTWSYIPSGLLAGLQARDELDVVSIEAQRSRPAAAALLAASKARGYGIWHNMPANRRLNDRRVRRGAAKHRVDAVLAVAELDPILPVPTYLYQDANFSVAKAYRDVLASYAPDICTYPDGVLDELIADQRRAYLASTTVFAFGQWFANWLIETDGVPAEQVRVIGGGVNARHQPRDLDKRGAGGTRVLFVGREFRRKGGVELVAAVEQLRKAGAGEYRLTVVGPSTWPMPGPIPEFVDFSPEIPPGELASMWSEHDVFAMPSWFEPYGLVFLEARAAGLPCVARDAYCMPELVPEGEAGRLIPAEGGVDELAEAIHTVSRDEALFERVAASAERVAAENTWQKVADAASEHIKRTAR